MTYPFDDILTNLADRALTSYNNLTKSLDPASPTDISAYRSWITAHTPMSQEESSFIQQESDLLSICPQSNPKLNSRVGTALETPIVLVAFALLSTVVVFKVVPQILGRVVMSAMVGVAALCVLSPELMSDLRGVRDWGKAVATYVPPHMTVLDGRVEANPRDVGTRLSCWCLLLSSIDCLFGGILFATTIVERRLEIVTIGTSHECWYTPFVTSVWGIEVRLA